MDTEIDMLPTKKTLRARRLCAATRGALGVVFALGSQVTPVTAAAGCGLIHAVACPQAGAAPVEASDARHPLPEPRACEEAEREIEKLLAAVGGTGDPAAEAEECAKRANALTPGTAVHFALLGRARAQALAAGALALALECAVAEVEGYRLDRFAALVGVAEAAGKVRPRQGDTVEQRALLMFGVEWCGRAIEARDLPTARRFLAIAQTRVRRSDLREFGPRVRDIAAAITLIERFEPARATAAQASKVVDAIVRSASAAGAIDLLAQGGGSSIGEVARRDREVGAAVDALLGFGAAGAPPRPRPTGGALTGLSEDVKAAWFSKATALASEWAALAADGDLSGLSADVCWDRAGRWHARAIEFAAGAVERLRLTTALAEFTKAQTRRAYLADLEPKEVSEIPYCNGLQRGDKLVFSNATQPIRIGGAAHTRCLGMHALEQSNDGRQFVWARFVVPRQAEWMRGAVAINDSGGTRSDWDPLVFEIWSGDQLLWWSRPIPAARVVDEFAVRVRAGSVVELRVRCASRGADGHAIWIDPYFVR